jgi:hypothetical protein
MITFSHAILMILKHRREVYGIAVGENDDGPNDLVQSALPL